MRMKYEEPIEIAENTYWVGHYDEEAGFHCNPYLIDDGEEAVLIDPGGITHYPHVLKKVIRAVDLDRIHHIILHHQDPDLCASTPRYEELINHEVTVYNPLRASFFIPYYGIKSRVVPIRRDGEALVLKSGRRLEFYLTPFVHFAGSMVTYDTRSKVLFSSDIFGAFSFDWSLYAREDYLEAVKAFLEPYVGSKKALENVARKLEQLDIEVIAPQHGSIITDNIPEFIQALREMDAGVYLE